MGPVEIELVEQANVSTGTFLVAGAVKEGAGGGPVGVLVLPDGSRVVAGDDPISIGRLAECDIPLPGDTNVSRRHAEVRRDGDEFMVADLDSLNGTKVNGAGIRTRRLVDGDEITVGLTTLRFETS
jgi:pSer/pThr/pTyr-binding forkhead associated (FHA) protein